jgi:hypothetical protein
VPFGRRQGRNSSILRLEPDGFSDQSVLSRQRHARIDIALWVDDDSLARAIAPDEVRRLREAFVFARLRSRLRVGELRRACP